MVTNRPSNKNNGDFYFPGKEIVKKANVKEYESLYKKSIEDRESFWVISVCF